MNVGEAVEICHNFAFLRIENDELVGVHVGDIKTAMGSCQDSGSRSALPVQEAARPQAASVVRSLA